MRAHDFPSPRFPDPAYDDDVPRFDAPLAMYAAWTEPLAWWYKLSAPQTPGRSAGFEEHEAARRGRLLSLLILGLACVWVVVLLLDFFAGHGILAAAKCVAGALFFGASWVLNRRGRVTPAACMLIVLIALGFLASEAMLSGGAAPHATLFSMLIVSELVAATLLEPSAVFVVATLNCALIVLNIMLWPVAVRDQLGTPTLLFGVVLVPVVLHLLVALVLYTAMRSLLTAMQSSHHARQHELQARDREEARRRMLQEGVEQMLEVLVLLANGNYRARVPMLQDPLLWKVGVSLNTFIRRVGRLELDYQVMERVRDDAQRLAEIVTLMRAGVEPEWPLPSGTPLDPLIIALCEFGGRFADPADATVDARPNDALTANGRVRIVNLPGGREPATTIEVGRATADFAEQAAALAAAHRARAAGYSGGASLAAPVARPQLAARSDPNATRDRAAGSLGDAAAPGASARHASGSGSPLSDGLPMRGHASFGPLKPPSGVLPPQGATGAASQVPPAEQGSMATHPAWPAYDSKVSDGSRLARLASVRPPVNRLRSRDAPPEHR